MSDTDPQAPLSAERLRGLAAAVALATFTGADAETILAARLDRVTARAGVRDE